MLTKIVQHMRECVGFIAGSNTLMNPWRSNIGEGVRTPVTPAALTPMRTEINSEGSFPSLIVISARGIL